MALLEWMLHNAAQQSAYEGRAFYSPYPLGHIWKINLADALQETIVDLNEGGGWFVVQKLDGIVQWQKLDMPQNAFDQPIEISP